MLFHHTRQKDRNDRQNLQPPLRPSGNSPVERPGSPDLSSASVRRLRWRRRPHPRPTRDSSEPEATKPRANTAPTTEQGARPQATRVADPGPTRTGILGRVDTQPTVELESTEPAGTPMPRLLGIGGPGTEEFEFVSVSAGDSHTCGLRTDGTVACWGEQARGITADYG